MRMSLGLSALLALAVAFAAGSAAQNPDAMMPAASEAKGRQILKDLIEALGGPAYLGVTQRECDGRRAQFGSNGDLTGYIPLKDYWTYPDKNRTDYIARGHNTILGYMIGVTDLDVSHGGTIVTLFNRDRGWVMSRAGVEEMPADTVSAFQEAVKRNVDNILRVRLNEPGIQVRFGGNDIVDLHPAEWVEIRDQEQHIYRLAVEKATHLLLRSVAITRDKTTGERIDESAIYSNFQRAGSLYVPMQITRERNGRKYYQVFFDSCTFNPGLADDFFAKSALEKKYAEAGYKKQK